MADGDGERDRRAEAIFRATVDLPPAERSAAVAAACGGDADLRARVESLFDALSRADRFLADATAVPPGEPPSRSAAERPGDLVGPYRLQEQIGEGGFGIVYMAEQSAPVRRRVAVKVLKLGMDTKEVVARFDAERQALALMDHPNIAKVLDAGSTAAGRPYFAMELVVGSPITDYADRNRLTTAQRVELSAAVCRAVQHAHGKGVIHRDLKPTNVLVTTAEDGRPMPKVIDFGIAKATQAPLTDRTVFTAFRQLMGTPQYMSPEQADSDGADVDTRTDVYSLGVLLYELLTGTTPLDGRSLRSAAMDAMRRMIRDADPARPSTRLSALGERLPGVAAARGTDARRLSRLLNGELDWIVMRALEKDRTRRYDTAAALADDLDRHLAGEAVVAGPASGLYRVRKLAGRYRVAVGVGAAVATSLLVGAAGTTWGLVLARHERAVAVANERRARAGERSARAVADFLTDDVLAKASPEQARDAEANRVLVDALITPALASVGPKFGDDPVIRAAIQYALAGVLLVLGRYDQGEGQARAAYEARRATLGPDHPDTLAAQVRLGDALNYLRRFDEAADIERAAWEAARRAVGDDHPTTLWAQRGYGVSLAGRGRADEAVAVLGPAHARAWRLPVPPGGDDRLATRIALDYGRALRDAGRADAAADVCRADWERARRSLGPDHPRAMYPLATYGEILIDLGRYDEGLAALKQATDLIVKVYGPDHRQALIAVAVYAQSLTRAQRPAEAAALYPDLCERYCRALGVNDPEAVGALVGYAQLLVSRGQRERAIALLGPAVARARQWAGGDDHAAAARVLDQYAQVLQGLDRDGERADLMTILWDHRNDMAVTPMAWSVAANWVDAMAAAGRLDAATALSRDAWERVRHAPGPVDAYARIICLDACYDALLKAHRYAEADPLLREEAAIWSGPKYVDSPDCGPTLDAVAQNLIRQGKWPEAEAAARTYWAWAGAHAAAAGQPGAVSASLRTLNQCLAAQGKPAAGPTTAPVP